MLHSLCIHLRMSIIITFKLWGHTRIMVRKNSQQCLNVTSQITNSYLEEMIDLWSVVSVENVIANKILKYKYNIQPMNEQIKIWINEQLKEQILSSSFNYINLKYKQTTTLVYYRLDMKQVKGSAGQHRLCYCCESGVSYLPRGIGFIKTVKGKFLQMWFQTVSSKPEVIYYCGEG